jgi:hypothetical protein
LRPLFIGASLLALVVGFTTPAPGSVSNQNLTGLFPTMPWDFSTATNILSGEHGGQFIGSSLPVRGSLQVVFDWHFLTIFTLDVDFTSPLLGFTAHVGDWETYVWNGSDPDCEPGGPTSLAGRFTTDYTGSFMPLFNALHTFAIIPSPPPGALLGLGVAILRGDPGTLQCPIGFQSRQHLFG